MIFFSFLVSPSTFYLGILHKLLSWVFLGVCLGLPWVCLCRSAILGALLQAPLYEGFL